MKTYPSTMGGIECIHGNKDSVRIMLTVLSNCVE